MKTILTASLLLVLTGIATAVHATAISPYVRIEGPKTCLRADAVQNRAIPDDKTIYFRLNDGTVWKNTLQKTCVGLHVRDGFKAVTRDGWYCSNEQRIRVLNVGNTCYFGDFSRAVWPAK